MNFQEFANTMEGDLNRNLKDSYPDMVIKQNSVNKLQDESYTALSIMPTGDGIGVNINLDDLFDKMNSGDSYESVLSVATEIAERTLAQMPVWDVSALTNYQEAKHLLCTEVVGTERNAAMLENVPHVEVENLSMVYRLKLESNESGAATVLVTNDLMHRMGVTQEQIHADALENTPRVRPVEMVSLAALLSEIMGLPMDEMSQGMSPPTYVVTNEERIHGASAIFYPGMMEQAAKELGGNFFLLPSSVHEVLLLPDDGNMKSSELRDMVTSVNMTEVDPADQLTDDVYHYDAQEKVFELGEKFEARKAEKLNEKGVRCSVLKDLTTKQYEIDQKPTSTPKRGSNEPTLC